MWKKCEQEFAVLRGPFLDAFAKLQQLTISFIMSVCPFAWNNSDPTEWIFLKFDIYFSKICQEN